ncbi:MAG TPA: aspartyl/asparaginyl beta-hydroxylase domain-containing protein [Gammaproteobacteria bacterium]
MANADLPGLLARARRAMGARDYATARALWSQSLEIDPRSIAAWLNLAGACRQLDDLRGAFAALREVLRLDPRNFHALLMNGSLLEREGRHRAAAAAYGAALANAPPESHLDSATCAALEHARAFHAKHTRELGDFIRAETAEARARCAPAGRRRVDAFIDMALRLRKRYRQEPTDYFYPGLPAIEFYDRDEFPWLAELEAAGDGIRAELEAILREDAQGFEPYIQYDDHLPLDQWRELNHSPRWSAFHFFDRGRPIEERLRRAPATAGVLEMLPQPHVQERSPSALFSVLQPKTRIPPHTGVANFRLVVHLPLIVPGRCGFRVGGETREWRVGEAWVFDDTIEHEAWNDSDEPRVILICDIWSPRLAAEEREAIAAVIAAADAFGGAQAETAERAAREI